MRIVVDAMGSDNNPGPDVAGAVMAARKLKDTIILVGDEQLIKAELAKHDTNGLSIEIVHASQVITMDDKPSLVVREKKDSSMHVGINLVKTGDARCICDRWQYRCSFRCGHAAQYRSWTNSGIKRPALGVIFPYT